MPRAGVINAKGGKPIDYYEISMRQFEQQILPAGMPATPVWGYGAISSDSNRGLLLHNAPSLTIEARWKRPVQGQVDQRASRRERELSATPAPRRPDTSLGEPAGGRGRS